MKLQESSVTGGKQQLTEVFLFPVWPRTRLPAISVSRSREPEFCFTGKKDQSDRFDSGCENEAQMTEHAHLKGHPSSVAY